MMTLVSHPPPPWPSFNFLISSCKWSMIRWLFSKRSLRSRTCCSTTTGRRSSGQRHSAVRCRASADMTFGRPRNYAYSPNALRNHNPDPDPDLWPIPLKIGAPVTPALRNVHANFGFSALFLLPSYELVGVDTRQTDGRTRPVARPIRTAAE